MAFVPGVVMFALGWMLLVLFVLGRTRVDPRLGTLLVVGGFGLVIVAAVAVYS